MRKPIKRVVLLVGLVACVCAVVPQWGEGETLSGDRAGWYGFGFPRTWVWYSYNPLGAKWIVDPLSYSAAAVLIGPACLGYLWATRKKPPLLPARRGDR